MADTNIKITADNSSALRSIEQINRALGNIQNSANAVDKSMSRLTSTMGALISVMAGASLFNFVDGLQNMQNKLRIVSGSTEEFNRNMAYVKAIADSTGQSLNAIGDVYSKVAANADKLGYNTQQVATVTNAMAMALKASGASAEGSRATLYQFGQILNKGKLNGDEFTTMVENLSGNVLNTLIKNMGITRQEFEAFKSKGLIGSKDFTNALIKSIGELDQMQGKTLPTLGQSLQRVQNAFADLIIKLDQSTGVTQAIAKLLEFLAQNARGVAIALTVVAGAWAATKIAAWAGMLITAGRAILTVAAAFRTMGTAAAVAEALATGGLSAITAAAGATAAFIAANYAFDQIVESSNDFNVNLKETGVAAQQGLGETNNQLTGIGDKLKEILRDLDQQIALGGLTSRQYQIENELLSRNKDLGYQMTEGQKAELRNRLVTLEVMKAQRNVLDSIQQNQIEYNGLLTFGSVELKQQQALAKYRLETGKELTGELRQQLLESIKQVTVQGEVTKISKDWLDTTAQLTFAQQNLNKYTQDELDAKLQVLQISRDLGVNLDNQKAAAVAITLENKKQLEYLKQMKSAVEAVNAPLGGAAAGASAAGQLGGLDPVKAAMTANQTLFDGLKYLREQDLISEQQYQTAKVNASVQAQQAIMDATKKQYENAQLLRIQQQTGTTFGFETQKQMAQEAAAFQMKTDTEKTAFALDQASQLFSALGAHNKKAFEAAKAFNIANAIMNTYMAATKALATYPPPFNFLAMGTAIALGLAQVATIRSQQYSGRALGGPVMGNTPYIVGERGPELFTPNTTGSITRNSDLMAGGGSPTVNFNIQAVDASSFDQLLVSRRGMITQIISDAMAEKGQRSRM